MLGNHAPEKEGLFNSSMEENDMKDDSWDEDLRRSTFSRR
jgi:hypothetical protein